jgi:dTDP-4-amino-4,6-dideoxygalactose transaminase
MACDMAAIQSIAARHRLLLIEDAAQAIGAAYRGRPLGSFGQLAALSFHETKNVISGEGGALLVNAPELARRAEIVREKGTNRGAFFRGEVDKYTWVDVGSSFLPSDIIAAFLWAQFEQFEEIAARRSALWRRYHEAFADLEKAGLALRPRVPPDATPNAHCYFLLLPDAETRTRFIAALRRDGVNSVFHYVPLHSAPAGRKFARTSGSLSVTQSVSDRLTRLPLWLGLEAQQDYVIERCRHALAR